MDGKSLRKEGPIGKATQGTSGAPYDNPGLRNTAARPCAAHSDAATNVQTKHSTSHKDFGGLGGKGSGGAT